MFKRMILYCFRYIFFMPFDFGIFKTAVYAFNSVDADFINELSLIAALL